MRTQRKAMSATASSVESKERLRHLIGLLIGREEGHASLLIQSLGERTNPILTHTPAQLRSLCVILSSQKIVHHLAKTKGFGFKKPFLPLATWFASWSFSSNCSTSSCFSVASLSFGWVDLREPSLWSRTFPVIPNLWGVTCSERNFRVVREWPSLMLDGIDEPNSWTRTSPKSNKVSVLCNLSINVLYIESNSGTCFRGVMTSSTGAESAGLTAVVLFSGISC